jgi:CRISPR/Cas system-associated exonuclease Cas4 (RecB family)
MDPLTPSGLARANACPVSPSLPQARLVTPYTRRGTALHRFFFLVSTQGVDAALSWLVQDSPDLVPAALAIDLNRLPASRPESFAAEVGIGWDPATGKAVELGRGLEREEIHRRCPEGWMPMILDVLGETPTASVVYDYKTGWSEVDAAEDNWQLDGYSVGAAALLGKDESQQGIIRVPADEGKDPWFNVATLDSLSLQMATERIRDVLARVNEARTNLQAGRPPEFTLGPHCRRCGAFSFCPATQTLLRSLVVDVSSAEATKKEIDRFVTNLAAAVTLDNFGNLRDKLVAARNLVKEMLEVMDKFAEQQGPVPLGNGWFYGAVVEEKEYVHAETVKEVMAEMHGEEAMKVAVELKLKASQASIERALRPRKELIAGSTYAGLKRAVMAELRKRAGVSVRRVESTKRFKHDPEPKKLAK